jgi:hypothetical protein
VALTMRIEGCHAAGASPAACTSRAQARGGAVDVGLAFELPQRRRARTVRVLHARVVTGLASALQSAGDTVARAVTG